MGPGSHYFFLFVIPFCILQSLSLFLEYLLTLLTFYYLDRLSFIIVLVPLEQSPHMTWDPLNCSFRLPFPVCYQRVVTKWRQNLERKFIISMKWCNSFTSFKACMFLTVLMFLGSTFKFSQYVTCCRLSHIFSGLSIMVFSLYHWKSPCSLLSWSLSTSLLLFPSPTMKISCAIIFTAGSHSSTGLSVCWKTTGVGFMCIAMHRHKSTKGVAKIVYWSFHSALCARRHIKD